MIIIGTGGFALESYEILLEQNFKGEILFYNDIDSLFQFDIPQLKDCQIIRSYSELEQYFKVNDTRYVLGVGNPKVREILFEKINKIGGTAFNLISPMSKIGNLQNVLGTGVNIMTGTIITSDITISDGVLINLNCTIGHSSKIGRFSEICPSVNISGNCHIGDSVFIGTDATIIPNIKIGSRAVIAAGSVVIKDVEEDTMVAGNPATFKRLI